MNYIKHVIAFASFLMLFSCNRDEHVNYLKFDKNGLCVLTDWLMVGPFKYDTIRQKPRETFFNRDLDYYSINEDSFKVSDLEILKKKIKNGYLIQRFATNKLKLYTDTIADKSNCYLATVLKSDKEQELVLLFDGAASVKVWLNQELIYQTRSNSNMLRIGSRFIPIHLKKGNNIFFAKVNREANKEAWGFYLALTTQQGSAEIFHYNYMNDFVTNPIILDTLTFYSGSLDIEKAEVYTMDTIISPKVFNKKNNNHYISGLGSLPEGFYNFRVITNNDTLTQKIYKGNILNFYQKLKARYLLDENKTNESQAMIQRIDFIIEIAGGVFPPLTSNGYYPEGTIWQQNTKLFYWVERFNSMTKNEGLMFKTYVSSTDKSINHFILYVDKSLMRKPEVPLVVVMPYWTEDLSFPTSWYCSNLVYILVDCRLASERGFAICWLFAKGSQYTLPGSVEDFNCSLSRIKTEFGNINVDKIYLTGECLGAKRALTLAECIPERIKALSLKSPLPKMEYYNTNIASIAEMPIFIEHGIYDPMIPINDMRLFITSISKDIHHLKYVEVEEGHASFRKDNRKNTFDFFKVTYEK